MDAPADLRHLGDAGGGCHVAFLCMNSTVVKDPVTTCSQNYYPARKVELTPQLINYFWKTTIEALDCQINSPTEDN